MRTSQSSFIVLYPLGIEDERVKQLMHCFTKMMFNGFAHYDLIEKVVVTRECVYVVTIDDVKEYVQNGENLDYIRSHDKKSF